MKSIYNGGGSPPVFTSSIQKLDAATGLGSGGQAHIVTEALDTLGESGGDAGLVAFDEMVSIQVLVERTIFSMW
jgi:hypothetical protein